MSEESRRAEILRRKDTFEDLMDEVREYRDMSPAERDLRIQQVCRLAAQILKDRPDRARILQWDDPLPESSIAILKRLREQYRRARTSR